MRYPHVRFADLFFCTCPSFFHCRHFARKRFWFYEFLFVLCRHFTLELSQSILIHCPRFKVNNGLLFFVKTILTSLVYRKHFPSTLASKMAAENTSTQTSKVPTPSWISSWLRILWLYYRKPPNISPGLIFVRKHFLVGLYMGGLYTGGLYTDKILC